jgi:protocatechuate 3,4-dioxygenase, alpha subunit
MTEPLTPSQTAGPYFAMRLPFAQGPYVVPAGTPGALVIYGRLYDGAGDPIPDGLIETWQADPKGRFAHPDDPRGPIPDGDLAFRGFGRCPTGHDGTFRIVTLKPGPLPFGDGRTEAPHVNVSVLGRGMLDRSVTRVYFPDEADANDTDPVLRLVPEHRRHTLVAVPAGINEETGQALLRFDIRMQGDHETVFFDL